MPFLYIGGPVSLLVDELLGLVVRAGLKEEHFSEILLRHLFQAIDITLPIVQD
jgi:hypothetical protein